MRVRMLVGALVGALAFGGVVGLPKADAATTAARTPIKNCYDIPEKVYAPTAFGISFGEVSIPGQRGCLTTRPNGVQRMRTTVPFGNKPSCRVYPGPNIVFSTIGGPSMTTTQTSRTATITTVWCDLKIQILNVPTPVTFSWKVTREIFTWGSTGNVTELTQGTTCKYDRTACNAPTVLSFTSH